MACRDPLNVKALTKESKIDPEFRRQMWALVSTRQQQLFQEGQRKLASEEGNTQAAPMEN